VKIHKYTSPFYHINAKGHTNKEICELNIGAPVIIDSLTYPQRIQSPWNTEALEESINLRFHDHTFSHTVVGEFRGASCNPEIN